MTHNDNHTTAADMARARAEISRKARRIAHYVPDRIGTVVALGASVKYEVPDCFDLDLVDYVYKTLVDDMFGSTNLHLAWTADRVRQLAERPAFADGETLYADGLLDVFTLMMRHFPLFVASSADDPEAVPQWAAAARFAALWTAGDDK